MQQHQTLSVLPCFRPAWLRLLSMFSLEFWFLPAYQAGCDEFGVPADHSGHRSGPGLAFRAFLSFQVGKSKDTMANDTAGCERPAGSGTQILHSEYSEQTRHDPYDPWYPWRFEQILQVGTPSKTVTVHFLRCDRSLPSQRLSKASTCKAAISVGKVLKISSWANKGYNLVVIIN